MAYKALYRKWRPDTFDSVIGQHHITDTIRNEILSSRLAHAYLFTGTRGTGKTSTAKILSRAVNCMEPHNGNPCNKCECCRNIINELSLDVMEIDAASNTGVDNIRDIIEQLQYLPSMGKYKVYIIDEVHMLSPGAFNALLKTLEEPPEHIIFILATTEVHKLPATILSRCQRFDFRRIETSKICERLQFVAQKENLTLSDSAATLIASAADGGMRDALSILDLCASSSKKIDESTVESVCAMAGHDYLLELGEFIKQKDTENALLMLDKLHNSSVDMLRLLQELISHYRDLMIVKTVKKAEKPIVCSASRLESLENQAGDYDIKDIIFTLTLLQSSLGVMQNGNRRCEMEMTLIKLCNPSLSIDLEGLERRISALENGNIKPPVQKPKSAILKEEKPQEIEEIPLPNPPQETIAQPLEETKTPSEDGIRKVAKWNEILAILKTSCPLIAGVLGDSTAYIKGDYLLIDAKNSQFRTLIKSANGIYKDNIRKAAEQVLGATYKLGPYKAETATTESDPLLSIANKLKNLEI